MTEKQQVETQLWHIANILRGKMHVDDLKDYILGFIFYKYLSEKMHTYTDERKAVILVKMNLIINGY